MKKTSLLVTLFVMAALTLAACTAQPSIPATGPSAASTPSGATTGTPSAAAVSPTAQATSSAGATAAATDTSAAPTSAAATSAPTSGAATAAPTSAASATSPAAQATSAAPTSANPSGGATAQATATTSASTGSSANQTTTPSAAAGTTGTPQASANQAQFLRLSNLMNYTVQTSDNQQVGAVNSVIVERPMVATGQSTNTTSVSASAPFVRYVVVNINSMISSQNNNNSAAGTGSQILVPWQAFNFNNVTTNTNSSSLTASTSTLTLNVTMTVFVNAPRVDVTQLQSGTSNTWQSQASQYWAGQGVNAAGNSSGNVTSQSGDMVVIGKQMNGFNVVGADNAVLGQVADFLVDMKTGAISYAVITPQNMNGQSFFIPLSNLSWVLPVGQNTMTNLGNLAINLPQTILQNAPSFGALNNLQLNPNWAQQVNQFWQSIQNTPVK